MRVGWGWVYSPHDEGGVGVVYSPHDEGGSTLPTVRVVMGYECGA